MTRARRRRKKLHRPMVRCPKCNKAPGIRMDRTFARILGYIVFQLGGQGRAMTVKCSRCRHVYNVEIDHIALADAEG